MNEELIELVELAGDTSLKWMTLFFMPILISSLYYKLFKSFEPRFILFLTLLFFIAKQLTNKICFLK